MGRYDRVAKADGGLTQDFQRKVVKSTITERNLLTVSKIKMIFFAVSFYAYNCIGSLMI